MLKETVTQYYLEKNCNCAEAVLHGINDCYGLALSEKDIHLLSGFGGGCGCGLLCGALAAAVAGLGHLMVESRAHETPGFREACGALCGQFEAALGNTACSQLRPQYFKENVRCLEVLENAADCFEISARVAMEGKK